jgi:hypothetical protein
MPVSMTAIVTPLPRVVCQACRTPYSSSQYSAARAGSPVPGGGAVVEGALPP